MKIICPLTMYYEPEFLRDLDALAQSDCDWIELRLDDLYNETSVEEMMRYIEFLEDGITTKPFIYTLRTDKEGGNARISDRKYEDLIHQLFKHPGMVDIEFSRFVKMKRKPEDMSRVILSYHNFDETPTSVELDELWEQMMEKNPGIAKIAVMPHDEKDVRRLLQSCKEHPFDGEKIAISMSDLGKISRIIGDAFDSAYTFAVYTRASAPGQPSLEEIKFYRNALDN